LLDDLTVAGNLFVALKHAQHYEKDSFEREIKRLLEAVGLDYQRDANKRPSQLSGGMARRASLALQLAQRKRCIVLDEPFTGLDEVAAMSVAKELQHLRQSYGTALLLISHEPHLAKLVMAGNGESAEVDLVPPANTVNGSHADGSHKPIHPHLFGTTFLQRLEERLVDYIGWSLPLILMTFFACGLALSMLSCDILKRIDVTDRVLSIVDTEVKPLLQMVNGGEVNTFHLMAVKLKVRQMLNSTVPQAKAILYAMGMAKLFVLEIGPLLTALLLCGRIGGSFAGRLATMHATQESKLLKILGLNSFSWMFLPSLGAALLAAPVLTMLGTGLALALGAVVGPWYGIVGTTEDSLYWEQVKSSVFPELRLQSLAPLWAANTTATPAMLWDACIRNADYTTPWSHSFLDTVIEISTYPVVYHLLKALVYITIILLTAQVCCSVRSNHLTPRHVPVVITMSVVLASLLVICADWGFSQLLLLRF
jgi:ABC-type transporter Mla maintaining outer membrane lipid asymmetry permease subunit MlaE